MNASSIKLVNITLQMSLRSLKTKKTSLRWLLTLLLVYITMVMSMNCQETLLIAQGRAVCNSKSTAWQLDRRRSSYTRREGNTKQWRKTWSIESCQQLTCMQCIKTSNLHDVNGKLILLLLQISVHNLIILLWYDTFLYDYIIVHSKTDG